MVSAAQAKVLVWFFSNEFTPLLKFLIGNWSQINPNFISQSVIKPDMKIRLRMEGTVNGHYFVIEGEGKGKPYE